MRVGFVGATGLMGHGMAKNILRAGHELRFTLRREHDERVQDLVNGGATRAASIADLGRQCEMVIICVTSSPDVEAVVAELLTDPAEGLVIADTSTSEPSSTRMLAAQCEAAGVGFVDAPLTRSAAEAEAGILNSMVGGKKEHIEKARPVIECYTEFIMETGEVGSAHTIKLLNNTVIQAFTNAMAEAMGLAAKAGADPRALVKILSKGGMNSGNLDVMGRAIDGDFDGMQFALDNARKDVRYYNRLAADLGYVAPMGAATHQSLAAACTLGFGQEYTSATVKGQETLNGVSIVAM